MKPLRRVGLRSFRSVAAGVVCLCSILLLPGCSPNMDALIGDLGSNKPEVVQRAETQLLAHRDEAAAALELALTNPSPAVRANACPVLAKAEGGRAAAGIARLLADGDASVREAAGTTLIGMGEGAAAGIAAGLKDFGASETYLGEAAKCMEGLTAALGEAAAEPLSAALKDPSAAARAGACKLLATTLGGRAAGDIAALLADRDAMVSGEAMHALLQMDNAVAVLSGLPAPLAADAEALLAGALKDPSAAIRIAACQALAATKGAGAADDIVALLADEDPSVCAAALAALRPLGDAAIESYAREYAAHAGSESYAQAARELLGDDTGKSVEVLSALYAAGDDAMKETVLTLFATIGDPAYRKFADGYLKADASAASRDADLQMLRAMGAPAAEWLAEYYGKAVSAAEKTEILRLVILVSDSPAGNIAAASRLYAAKGADADTLALYRSSDAGFKARIVSFLKLAGAEYYQRFMPYADAAKYPGLAGIVPQLYSDIGLDAVKMLLSNPSGEKLSESILKRMNQKLVKKSLFSLVDDSSFGDKAMKCIQHIGYPAFSADIIAYAKKNENNKDNFSKAMDMIDSSKPRDDIVKYLVSVRDTKKACAYPAYEKLESFTGTVPAAPYRPALKYTGSGSGSIGRVVVLDYLYDGNYNKTPRLTVDSYTFTSIPARHILSCKALGKADAAILIREKIVSVGTWYYVNAPSVHYKGYRIDTEISLIDLKRHRVIYKKTLADKEPYYFNEYEYRGSTVMFVETEDYYSTDVYDVVDWIIKKYLR